MLRIGSLCTGYGGIEMAVQAVAPAAPAWFCEWEDDPSRILAHHHPDTPNYRDLTAVDWSTVPPVDVLTAGYPCQPFSTAGRRRGTDDERHLWPHIREAIRVLRPQYVFLENVAGHRSMGFGSVLGDMAEDGLHVRWTSIRASDVGAPHHRERVFILAATLGCDGLLPDSDGFGWDGWGAVARAARGTRGEANRRGEDDRRAVEWGKYAPAVRRWEQITGVPAPHPVEPTRTGRTRLAASFAEWVMGIPAGHVTAPEIGLPRRAQLKAIGNGVCPPQAAYAFARLLNMEVSA